MNNDLKKIEQKAAQSQIRNFKKLRDAFIKALDFARERYPGISTTVTNEKNQQLCFDTGGFCYKESPETAFSYFLRIEEDDLDKEKIVKYIQVMRTSSRMLFYLFESLEEKRIEEIEESEEIDLDVNWILSTVENSKIKSNSKKSTNFATRDLVKFQAQQFKEASSFDRMPCLHSRQDHNND